MKLRQLNGEYIQKSHDSYILLNSCKFTTEPLASAFLISRLLIRAATLRLIDRITLLKVACKDAPVRRPTADEFGLTVTGKDRRNNQAPAARWNADARVE
jgi:hypothetical protein